MSHCPNCGTQVTAGARFCTTCGAQVSDVPGSTTTRVRPSAETLAAQEEALLKALRKATLGEYEVLGEIGRGGMAMVFLAHDLALDRKVAIKVMLPGLLMMDPGIHERFTREARTAASLSHPHIIPVYAVKESRSLLYFVMKFIVGRSLESVIKEVGAMPIPVVQTILGQVGSALGYAHKHGVVHRDMKPGNVMLDEDGWVVVTDFGIAKVADAEALTQTGGVVGTPAYMSPEQCSGGAVTGASDQYSLGIMAYEMIAGHQPFSGATLVNLIYDHCHTPPPPLAEFRRDCPASIAAAVMRMLEKDPQRRWPTVEDAVEAIGVAAETERDEAKTHILTLAATKGTGALLNKFKTPGSPLPATVGRKPTPAPSSGQPPGDAGAAREAARARRASPLLWAVPLALALLAGGYWLVRRGGHGGASPEGSAPVAGPAAVQPHNAGVERLDLAPLTLALAPGERATIRAEGRDANGNPVADAAVSWESSDAQVATVSDDGVVLAVAPGAAQVRARSGGSSAAAAVTVSAPSPAPRTAAPAPTVVSIAVVPPTANVVVGESVRLSAVATDAYGKTLTGGAVRWSTVDSGVVRVSSDGVVTGLAAGSAQVAAVMGGHSAMAVVTVTPVPVALVEVTPARGTLKVGSSLVLRATPRDRSGAPLGGRIVGWQSGDPQIASVADGAVSGLAPGTVTISATSGGSTGTAEITVEGSAAATEPPPAAPAVNPRPAIEQALDRYRRAIESRDLAQLRAAYPGLTADQERAWREFFGNVSDLAVTLKIDDLEVAGSRADVRISGTYEFRSGSRQTQHVELAAVFEGGSTGWRLISIK
jgi:serine/threonine protein kinase/uncharacterized protein YjdB